MAEFCRQKVKTVDILRNCLKKRLVTDPEINQSLLSRVTANPVDQRYDVIINALVDNRPDCFDESVLGLQEGFLNFFRKTRRNNENNYEFYGELLWERIFNNGTHIHSNDIYEAVLLIFALARDRLLVADIEGVELLITWTARCFAQYEVDAWIEEQGGWDQLTTEPFVPGAPGSEDEQPPQRVTNEPDYGQGNIFIPQTTTGAQLTPFYGASLQQPYMTNPQQPYVTNPQQPYMTNPQQPYMVNPAQPYVVNVQTPYLVNPQLPQAFVPSQPYMALPQQPYMALPQQPYMVNPPLPYMVYPQNPYTVINPYQPLTGNPQQPYGFNPQQPYMAGNLFRTPQQSVVQNFPAPMRQGLIPRPQRSASHQIPRTFSSQASAARPAQTQQPSRRQSPMRETKQAESSPKDC